MTDYFLDSSALAKFYHEEVGTAKVEQIIEEVGANLFISRLTAIEIHSVFAGKVRSGAIAESQFNVLSNRFRNDLTALPLQVVAMARSHFQVAEQLIRKHGTSRSLRTLDALQLSTALHVARSGMLDYFVCADQRLCTVAQIEGLSVINPEHP